MTTYYPELGNLKKKCSIAGWAARVGNFGGFGKNRKGQLKKKKKMTAEENSISRGKKKKRGFRKKRSYRVTLQ